ncbi:MAG: winged helix-turn-helix domain-containing protein [Sarcina sp.]
MNYTERDYKILDFIQENPSTAAIIARFCDSSVQVIQRRLTMLVDNGQVKRHRVDLNSPYVYYLGHRPRYINHVLMCSKLHVYWKEQGYKIYKVKREVSIGEGLRCDSLFVLDKGRGLEVYIVEVEIWGNPNTKIERYERFFDKGVGEEKFGVTPVLLFITNKNVETKIDYEQMPLDFFE